MKIHFMVLLFYQDLTFNMHNVECFEVNKIETDISSVKLIRLKKSIR